MGLEGLHSSVLKEPEKIMLGSAKGASASCLPDDQEFFAAISDCTNVVIRAAGGDLSAYSGILQEQSPVFRAKLSSFSSGEPNTDFTEEGGKVVLNLDCSYDTAQTLFKFITSKGLQAPDKSASPAMLRELASMAHEWQVQPLLDMVDKVLASQTRADMEAFWRSDPKTWQYAGTHVRERGIQMLKLALQAGLKEVQTETELFVAANWLHLSEDDRLTKDLDINSLCRIHRLAEAMQQSFDPIPLGHNAGRRCSKRQQWASNHPRRSHYRTAKAK